MKIFKLFIGLGIVFGIAFTCFPLGLLINPSWVNENFSTIFTCLLSGTIIFPLIALTRRN